MPQDTQSYDYIIVGAGSAGCALAHRLSREASRRVLLLEAGPRDRNPMIHVPLGFAFLMKNPKINWCYETDPEPTMNNRKMGWPRGKVLGGSSAINGMVYIRGHREDFDAWAADGNIGWSYDDVLPYFRRSEHNENGASLYHGYGGPLHVGNVVDKMDLADRFIQAGIQAGIPHTEDFNGAQQEGMGYYQLNIKNGIRQSSARTFLAQCEQRPNLEVVTGAMVERVRIVNGRATGVEYTLGAGKKAQRFTVTAKSEIVLSGGTINSPQLLELSGIGNRDHLEKLGLPVEQHLPGVGENLQDHLTINFQQGLHDTVTFYEETRPLPMLKNLLKFVFQRKGLLIHPASQAGAFFRTTDEQPRPDAQIHFAPAAGKYNDKGNMVTVRGTTATVCHLRPTSRGSVHIRSTDPQMHPRIHANYLATPEDRGAIVAALRKVRNIFLQKAMDRYREDEIAPGEAVASDEDLLEFIRDTAESIYHPVGTCKMGQDDMAVVDDRLRVHGISNLRVADASIMPMITAGNTNAAAVMIAEKCADMLLEDAGVNVQLPASEINQTQTVTA